MAASITPKEAGMKLESVEMVSEWAKENYFRHRTFEQPIEYADFKEPQLREGI